ncbi:MAG: hypothetical protein IPP33_10580 [Flavobacteriales bacterium]|nr:hypothetical protein [Flavobacteriales bacterium]
MQLLLGFFEMSGHPENQGSRRCGTTKPRPDEELKKAHPQSSKPYSLEGDFYTRAGKFTEARDAFAKAVTYEQDKFPIWAARCCSWMHN